MSNFVTLLIEGDAFQREILAGLLKDEGFEVVECSTCQRKFPAKSRSLLKDCSKRSGSARGPRSRDREHSLQADGSYGYQRLKLPSRSITRVSKRNEERPVPPGGSTGCELFLRAVGALHICAYDPADADNLTFSAVSAPPKPLSIPGNLAACRKVPGCAPFGGNLGRRTAVAWCCVWVTRALLSRDKFNRFFGR